jgi:hypothetical protein
LLDVHNERTMLNINDSRFTLHGGTDIMIVPFKTSKIAAEFELCVLFELKTDVTINTKANHTYQAIAELIAARYNSNQPNVLVVLTDVNSTASAFELAHLGGANFSVISYNNLTLEQMASKVSSFLQSSVVADAHYRPPADEASASEFEKGVVNFKRAKVQQLSNLAYEHLQDMMMDPTDWTPTEKAHLFANFFASIERPMPKTVQYMMYS